ncbi:hypothetical protein DEU56DRAFT_803120 [Suillus clintonianus]|uniref:uncharacterized protein n=1 Tax=Suillus clintonianus TaxID=1904413 RepID=UPI001B87FDE6|nr:uncharacterized protein DEU56DRAFT_803120 [Suillus clintonianus]KAG2137928.1 hypothetical protein DEU56DRAFT_803120 [Suillus clintonianus]
MSSSTQGLFPQVDLGNTYGALFIGAIVAGILFGLTNVQAFIYFQTHRGTGTTFYKLVVIVLWILDALHLVFIVHCIYYYLVNHFADIGALTRIVWSFKLQIVCDVPIIHGVQLLYIHRIWIVSKGRSRVLPITAGIFVVLDSSEFITPKHYSIVKHSPSGVSIPLLWALFQCHSFSDLVGVEWSTYMALAAISCGDVLNASSLCYLLATSRTGFSSTDSSIIKLMGFIIDTGCLTSVCSIVAIITCAVMPKNYVFLGIECLVAKLYVNSFIALLNARHYLKADRDSIVSSKYHTRHSVYLPKLHFRSSQDEGLQRECFDPDNGVGHPIRTVQSITVGSRLSVDETEDTAYTCDDSEKPSYLKLV